MKLLLDTCTFLWMIAEVDKLSPTSREVLENGKNEVVMSQVSSWEIQIKYQTGKLHLTETPEVIVREGLNLHGIRYERIDDAAIWHLGKLPEYHKDPFDRLLIAHGLVCGMKILTPDTRIHRYPVPVLW